MRVALIDVDHWGSLKGCFPSLPLMKLSAWHKSQGDLVEWYDDQKHYDMCYVSKVFTFTPDFEGEIHADHVIRGGSGYAIHTVNGVEIYNKGMDQNLPYHIEHIYPDYDLYGITDTAYGFCSRGCPRGCHFCHVKDKEGRCSYKVADLSEFWNGQPNIQLMDPNTLACKEWKDILQQLIDSEAYVDFNQGVDIRIMTEEKAKMILKVRTKQIHFAWDRYQDKEYVVPRLKMFRDLSGWNRGKITVYILTNFDTTFEQDLERVMTCRNLNITPYVMRYNKDQIPRGSKVNALARWVNWKKFFWTIPTFEEYREGRKKGLW